MNLFAVRPSVVFQMIRFCVVGLLTTGLYFAATIVAHRFAHLSLAVAASLSYVFLATMNYLLHYSWTFHSSRRHSVAAPSFVGAAAVGMAINYAAVTLSKRWLLIPQSTALWVGVTLVLAWNYLVGRLWVFMDRHRAVDHN
jgi:putative flippase GtrA